LIARFFKIHDMPTHDEFEIAPEPVLGRRMSPRGKSPLGQSMMLSSAQDVADILEWMKTY
jgi:hypothetical protein